MAEIHQEGSHVWLEGVDRYRVMDPLFECVRVVLSYRGESYSPEYVQGISGAAFRIGGICPCAPTCTAAMSTVQLAQVFGYESTYLPLSTEGMDAEAELQKVLGLVKEEIREGRPAILWNAFTALEWDVVAGFDAEARQFLGRGSYAGMDGYAVAGEMRTAAGHPALGAILIGEKVQSYDPRSHELAALKEAVAHARTQKPLPESGEWVFLEGLQAYTRWWHDFHSNPGRPRTMGDSYCLGVYRSTHRAAADFLRELAPRYPEVAAHFLSAADAFTVEANALDGCIPLLGWEAPESSTGDRNAQAAALLLQARDAYARGIDAIAEALEVLK